MAKEDLAEKGEREIEMYEHQEEAKRQEAARLFDVKALALSTKKIYSVEHPKLGVIRYGLLTSEEVKPLKLQEIAGDEERMYTVAFGMLKKADSSITREEFDAMPFDVKNAVSETLAKVMPSFLPPLQLSGSAPAMKRKRSV